MRKITALLIAIACLVSTLGAASVHAQILDPVCDDTPDATVCQENKAQDPGGNDLYGPDGILTRIAEIISVVVGIASVIVLVISGLKYVTSGGDSGSISSAKRTMIYALVGLIVVAVSRALISGVLNRL